eukprot:Phypoly_transcript_12567.p1 GENE.Phypoly_transcript_12567~~Phypoly_transcript_12567.p1  ORF type:complete len:299 (+),score=46.82 Phypoly_transcript_12567:115-1011(+)
MSTMSTMNYPPMYSLDATHYKEFTTSQATSLYHIPLLSQLSQTVPPPEFQVFSVQDYLTLSYQPQLHPSFVNPYPTQLPHTQESSQVPALSFSPSVPAIPSIQTSLATASQPISPRQPSSPHTPRTSPRKTDHTNDFGRKFQGLIHSNQKANSQWRKFRNENKGQCTIKRCIRLRLAFCEKYGHEFSSLVTSKCFRGLGTRSNCRCALSSQPSDQSPPSPMSLSPPSPPARENIGSPMPCGSPTTTVSFQSSWTPSSPTLPDHQARVISFLEQLAKYPSGHIGSNHPDQKFCTDFTNA